MGAEDDMHHGKYTPQQLQQKTMSVLHVIGYKWPFVWVHIASIENMSFTMVSDPENVSYAISKMCAYRNGFDLYSKTDKTVNNKLFKDHTYEEFIPPS